MLGKRRSLDATAAHCTARRRVHHFPPSVFGYEISRRLELESLAAARSRGYRQAVTICTHRVTAVQAERAGVVRVATRDYATYEYAGCRVLCKVVDIHKAAIFLSKSSKG